MESRSMPCEPGREKRSSALSEVALAATLLAVFLALNVFTSERSPTVWQDEVMFADPAINLLVGQGFSSSAWDQPREEFFAGNSPLYCMCLYPWIACFGVSPLGVRSFDYVLIAAASVVLWHTLTRNGWTRTPAARALIVAAVLCGYGVSFSYRSARYDCLGMLVVVGMFALAQRANSLPKLACLALLAAALPWSGLQLIPYVATLGFMLVVVRGRQSLPEVFAACAGLLLGAASLFAFFNWHGVWPQFVNSVTALSQRHRTLMDCSADAARSLRVDPSRQLLIALLLGLLCWHLVRRRWTAFSLILWAIYFGVAVPAAMAFLGRFPIYYCWMSYAPMVICLGIWLHRASLGRVGKLAVVAIVAGACVIGLPARLLVTLAEWNVRDPIPVYELAKRNLTQRDVAYCDFEAYYAVKRVTDDVFLPTYLSHMTTSERASIHVAVIRPEGAQSTLEKLGGKWKSIEVYDGNKANSFTINSRFGIGSRPYRVEVFRREPTAGSADAGLQSEEQRGTKANR
jgi:hypothetical protein